MLRIINIVTLFLGLNDLSLPSVFYGKQNMSGAKFIFVTGGVISSLGKGLASASLGLLLQKRGFSVRCRKFDPYLNVDPGLMDPRQHGEVFITNDGIESDLDLGHYERFTDVSATSDDYATTGAIYSRVLNRERNNEFCGGTVQVIPHIVNEIKERILNNTVGVDFILCEIGGTVGDIEGLPFLEAIRQLRIDLKKERTLFLHLTYLPFVKTAAEVKTKPTQHSVKALQSAGIQPDILLCRSEIPVSNLIKEKLSLFCNVGKFDVIEALDAKNIYSVPIQYHNSKLDERVCEYFGYSSKNVPINALWKSSWEKMIENSSKSDNKKKRIVIVGKHVECPDAYRSLVEALNHSSSFLQVSLEIFSYNPFSLSVNDDDKTNEKSNSPFSENDFKNIFDKVDGIVIFCTEYEEINENVLKIVDYSIENEKPLFGINSGMLGMYLQLVNKFLKEPEEIRPCEIKVEKIKSDEIKFLKENKKFDSNFVLENNFQKTVEFSKNFFNYEKNNIRENEGENFECSNFLKYSSLFTINSQNSFIKEVDIENFKKEKQRYGAKLGAYDLNIFEKTVLSGSYGKNFATERFRNKFEIRNSNYVDELKKFGLVISSTSEKMISSIELNNKMFFVGVQFHPELLSRPLRPHPVITKFISKI